VVTDSQQGWRAVTLEGWIFASSVGASVHQGFDIMVTRGAGENLRAAPAGTLVAKLPRGFGLAKLGEERRWVHVQRAGWVEASALVPVAGDSGSVANHPDSSSASRVDSTAAQSVRQTAVFRAPEGPSAGSILATTPLRVLSRSGEWTRVQFEGWVKTADLATATPGVLDGVSAAELRADPQRYVGQTVRWKLQFIAVERSDELRAEIPAGAAYLLTRGPLPERGFVYVVVPDAKRALIQPLTPLVMVQVTARVRAARTRYLGNPVVDLVSLEVQSQP
jgi:hypothetical protein